MDLNEENVDKTKSERTIGSSLMVTTFRLEDELMGSEGIELCIANITPPSQEDLSEQDISLSRMKSESQVSVIIKHGMCLISRVGSISKWPPH